MGLRWNALRTCDVAEVTAGVRVRETGLRKGKGRWDTIIGCEAKRAEEGDSASAMDGRQGQAVSDARRWAAGRACVGDRERAGGATRE